MSTVYFINLWSIFMAYSDFSDDAPKSDPPNSWKSILTLLLMVVLGLVLLRFVAAFIVPILSLILLIFLFFRTVYYLFVNPENEDGRLAIDTNSFEKKIEHLFREDNQRTP